MKTKKLLSLVTALSMAASMLISVHTASAAEVTEDILTWDEIKTYVENNSRTVLGKDTTGKYYFAGYGEKPTYVADGDYFILISSDPGPEGHSAQHSFNIPSEEQIAAGNVHLEYEMNIPSMTSGETPVENKFGAWDSLLRQDFDSGRIFDYYKGTSSPAYFDIQKGKMKSGSVSQIKPANPTDTWFKVTTDVDYTERTAVLKMFDSASGTQIGKEQSFVLNDDATYLKNIYLSFYGAELKIRNVKASVSKTVKTAVTECSVKNGDMNVDTSAIMLTFNGTVAKSELDTLTATDAAGNTYSTYSAVNGNKAQVTILGAKKNTNYTLSLPASDTAEAFSVSFKSCSPVYTYKWSSIGSNIDRMSVKSNWGGTYSEANGEIVMLKKNVLNYSLETCAYDDDIVIVEYDEYIPSYFNGTENAIDTNQWNTAESLDFDNGASLSVYVANTILIKEPDAWHHVVWTYNFNTQKGSLVIDDTAYTPSTSGTLSEATYVKNIRFNAGGNDTGTEYKERHIKNITAKRVDGAWKNSWKFGNSTLTTDENGIVTITDENKAKETDNNKNVWSYSLANAITDGQVKVSYDFMANEALANSTLPEVRFYSGADMNTDGNFMVSYPYNAPEIRWAGGFKFNKPEALEANEWHTAEYVFDIDSTNGGILKYVTVDGEVTLANYEKANMKSLGCIEFWTYPDETVGAYELKIKNLSFEPNYTGDDITVTANIENEEEDVSPKSIELYFSSPITEESAENIIIYDEDGEEATDYTVTLNDTNTTAKIVMNKYTNGAMYVVVIEELDGYLGGGLKEEYELAFFAEENTVHEGNWIRSYTKHDSTLTTADGVTTITVTNSGEEGTQQTRDAWAYSLSSPITGTKVPVVVSYKFKANEALTKSEGSNIRFYPYEHGDKGGANICVDFPFTKPQFRWDNIKFNLKNGVTSLTANEWHDIKYVFEVDETDGTMLKYVVLDDVITYTKYQSPRWTSPPTQFQSVDFWFYSTASTTDNFELQIKDMSVVTGEVKEPEIFKIVSASTEETETNLNVNVQMSNTTTSDVAGKLIAAAYAGDGSLLGAGFTDVTVVSNDTNAQKTVTFKKPGEAYTIKVFVWDSLESMNSLCDSYPVN